MTFKLAYADYSGDMREQYDHFTKDQLIDLVLSFDGNDAYRKALAPEWVEQNAQYWGGPGKRWSPTLGYFVRTLAAHPTPTRNVMVQRLMMVASNRGKDAWLKMIEAATRSPFPAAKIKTALSDPLVGSRDTAIMKQRIRSWGIAAQKGSGMDCLP